MISIFKFFRKSIFPILVVISLFSLAFSFVGVNSFAQVTEDPCGIGFCIRGIQNNPVYDNAALTPGQRAFLIITDIAGILTFIVNAIAIIFFIYGAFQMLTSAGKAEKFQTGKKTLIYAIIGMVISVVAYGVIGSAINILNTVVL